MFWGSTTQEYMLHFNRLTWIYFIKVCKVDLQVKIWAMCYFHRRVKYRVLKIFTNLILTSWSKKVSHWLFIINSQFHNIISKIELSDGMKHDILLPERKQRDTFIIVNFLVYVVTRFSALQGFHLNPTQAWICKYCN